MLEVFFGEIREDKGHFEYNIQVKYKRILGYAIRSKDAFSLSLYDSLEGVKFLKTRKGSIIANKSYIKYEDRVLSFYSDSYRVVKVEGFDKKEGNVGGKVYAVLKGEDYICSILEEDTYTKKGTIVSYTILVDPLLTSLDFCAVCSLLLLKDMGVSITSSEHFPQFNTLIKDLKEVNYIGG